MACKPLMLMRVALANIPLTHVAHMLPGDEWRVLSGCSWLRAKITGLRLRRICRPTVARTSERNELYGATVVSRERGALCPLITSTGNKADCAYDRRKCHLPATLECQVPDASLGRCNSPKCHPKKAAQPGKNCLICPPNFSATPQYRAQWKASIVQ